MAMPLLLYFDTDQGTFRLDHEGIWQVPWFRKPRYLRWENVQRVQWGQLGCCLEGTDTTISMKFVPVTQQAKTRIESILSPHFDLSIKPVRQWSFNPNVRSFLHWLLKVIGISLVGTVIFIVPFAGLVLLNAKWVAVAWIAVFPLGIVFIFGSRVRRAEERINPTWRLWRTEEPSGFHS
jgi:hypothetical protein